MKTAKVGISAIVGSEPNQINYYSVDIDGTKYQESMHSGRWERLFITTNGMYMGASAIPKTHWRRVTSEKIISQLNAAVAEHLTKQVGE